MTNPKRVLRACVIIACLSPSVMAQEGREYLQGLLDRNRILECANRVTSLTDPNADRVHVEDVTVCEYQPDGTGVTWSANYTKVLTEKGRQEKQKLSFYYMLPFTCVAVEALELIKPDGSIVPIAVEENSKVMTDPSQMTSNIYDTNRKVLQVGVPGLQIGDIVHVVTRHETRRRLMPNTWDDYQVFESTAPIKHAVYEVWSPRERPLQRMALRGRMGDTVTYSTYERGLRVAHRWEVADVPRFHYEPAMPPSSTVIQRLLVSTVEDWETISRWYWQLSGPHLEATSPEMGRVVTELTENVPDRQQRIEAIFYWVSREIRYLGITLETESPGWEPHDVKLTFEKRYGVCRDKAALLVAMLRLAGFEAYPVLIDTGPEKDHEVPTILFNHAIAAVREVDGSYRLMDCTGPGGRDLLPGYLRGCSYLVARPEGETLRVVPATPAEMNMVFVRTTGALDARGRLTGETEIVFEGVNDGAYRKRFAQMEPEQRRDHLEGILKVSMPTAEVIEFDCRPVDMRDMAEPVSVRMKFAADDVLTGSGGTVVMPMPRLGFRVGLVNAIFDRTDLNERRFPLRTYCACGVREGIALRIDPSVGLFVSAPVQDSVENDAVDWTYRLEPEGTCIQEEHEFVIKTAEVCPPQYQGLKKSLEQIEYHGRRMPILARCTERESPESHAAVLDHRIDYRLTDEHSWTERHRVRKKILTRKGIRENAEVKLDYNPAWDELTLIRASVTNDGSTRAIGDGEIHRMDAEWVASAPRYPAGKILVVCFPTVVVGSVIDYEYLVRRKDRPFFSMTHVFRDFSAVRRQVVTLTAPASMPLRVIRDDNGIMMADEMPTQDGERTIAETVECRGEERTWRWTAEDQASLEMEDDLPPLHGFAPTVRVTAGTWGAYAEDVLPVLLGATRNQTAAGERALEIARNQDHPMGKIIAIRDFVAQNIRRVGPEFGGLPLGAVTPADQVLAEGYGNAADRAVLLYSMLVAIQQAPEFVLVSSGPPLEAFHRFEACYPSARTFGTVLIRLRPDSMDTYLNDSDQYAVPGATPAGGHLGLFLAEGRTETISIPQDREDAMLSEYRVTLRDQGAARIAVTRTSYGACFGEQRKRLAEMLPEERGRRQQELISQILPGAVAEGPYVTDFNSYPGVEQFSIRSDRYALREGDYLYFTLPGSIGGLFDVRSRGRANPFCYGRKQLLRSVVTVELPPEFSNVVLMPGQQEWILPAEGGTVRMSAARQVCGEDRHIRLTFSHEARLHPFLVEAGSYGILRTMENQLNHARTRMILLSRRGERIPEESGPEECGEIDGNIEENVLQSQGTIR